MPDAATFDAPAHAHGPSCYWDLRECRWVCGASTARGAAGSAAAGPEAGPAARA